MLGVLQALSQWMEGIRPSISSAFETATKHSRVGQVCVRIPEPWNRENQEQISKSTGGRYQVRTSTVDQSTSRPGGWNPSHNSQGNVLMAFCVVLCSDSAIPCCYLSAFLPPFFSAPYYGSSFLCSLAFGQGQDRPLPLHPNASQYVSSWG